MAKGAVAKSKIAEKLKDLFGENYVGESGGKHYVWENDGGEKVQIAISLTCPKNPIGTVDMSSAFGGGLDFEAEPVVVQTKFEPAEITEQEVENLAAMMERLGL
jgi:hypothetical protein